MKKTILMIGIIYVILVIFICGYAKEKNGASDNGTSAKTYTWTTKQTTDDMPLDLEIGMMVSKCFIAL